MTFQKAGGCDNFRKGPYGKYTKARDLAVAVANQRFHELSNPNKYGGEVAVGFRWGDLHLETIYNDWLRCVADESAVVKEYWIEKHGGYRNCPSSSDFIKFVHYYSDTPPGGDPLKDW